MPPARSLSIRYHTYEEVRFKDFVAGLLRLPLRRRKLGRIPRPARITPHSLPRQSKAAAGALLAAPERSGGRRTPQAPLTVRRLFERLNAFFSDSTVVVADVGDALFGATDLFIRERTEFISPAYYTSMGFAVPASVGAQLANPKLRPLVLVGDGAFQMTGMELATVARYHLNPVVVLLNNRGYGTERHMQDGPYNDLWPWQYHRLPEILGAGPRLRRGDRGRSGPRAQGSGAVDGELLPAGGAAGTAGSFSGAGTPGRPHGQAGLVNLSHE